MTAHDKKIIMDIFNLTEKAYTNATTEKERAARKAQCFIIMHIMQTFGFWEEYKQRNKNITEDKKQ